MEEKNVYDLIIIGGGPAGVTAGIYASRSNLKVAIIEEIAVGGQVNSTQEVDNYPGFAKISSMDLCQKFNEHAAQEEGREGNTKHRQYGSGIVQLAVLIASAFYPQRNGDKQFQDQRHEGKNEGNAHIFENNVRNGLFLHEGFSEVTAKELREPAPIAFQHCAVHAARLFEFCFYFGYVPA